MFLSVKSVITIQFDTSRKYEVNVTTCRHMARIVSTEDMRKKFISALDTLEIC